MPATSGELAANHDNYLDQVQVKFGQSQSNPFTSRWLVVSCIILLYVCADSRLIDSAMYNLMVIMKKETTLLLISGFIAVLFFYAALSKLMDYERSQWEMKNQIFSPAVAWLLTWLIPTLEILLMITLLFPNTRKKALLAAFILLSCFTIYIGIVMTGVFGRIPCSCGGILENMSYGTHLLFNLFFVALATLGLAIDNGWISHNRLFNLKTERSLPKN